MVVVCSVGVNLGHFVYIFSACYIAVAVVNAPALNRFPGGKRCGRSRCADLGAGFVVEIASLYAVAVIFLPCFASVLTRLGECACLCAQKPFIYEHCAVVFKRCDAVELTVVFNRSSEVIEAFKIVRREVFVTFGTLYLPRIVEYIDRIAVVAVFNREVNTAEAADIFFGVSSETDAVSTRKILACNVVPHIVKVYCEIFVSLCDCGILFRFRPGEFFDIFSCRRYHLIGIERSSDLSVAADELCLYCFCLTVECYGKRELCSSCCFCRHGDAFSRRAGECEASFSVAGKCPGNVCL